MKGFGVLEKGKVMWLDKPDPVCGPEDAIARPIALAPCTSDVHSGLEFEHLKNRILGHEAIGEIIEVGREVKDFKVGDQVVIPCTTPSWKHPDIEDSYHQQAGGLNAGINLSNTSDGTMAEKIWIRSADMNLALLPPDVSREAACMVTDMMTTGFHGAELGDVKYGDTVVVFGIGPVGLMAVAGSALRGAGRLIAVGTRPNCVEVAKKYGATDIVSYKDGKLDEQIMALTHGKGADVTIIAGGNLDTFYTAAAVTKNGGNIASITMFSEVSSYNIPAPAVSNWMGHKTIRGGLCPGGRKRMERLLSIVQAGRIDPTLLITHRFDKFEDIEPAFWLMVNKPKDLIKPIILL